MLDHRPCELSAQDLQLMMTSDANEDLWQKNMVLYIIFSIHTFFYQSFFLSIYLFQLSFLVIVSVSGLSFLCTFKKFYWLFFSYGFPIFCNVSENFFICILVVLNIQVYLHISPIPHLFLSSSVYLMLPVQVKSLAPYSTVVLYFFLLSVTSSGDENLFCLSCYKLDFSFVLPFCCLTVPR